MSTSIAPVSTAHTHAVQAHAVKSETKQSDSAKTTQHVQSADPRSAQKVSPRQSDAVLNLAIEDHAKISLLRKNEARDRTGAQAADRA
ncbi:hypothetical protein MKK84_01050 [Methylobacterium sp. E-065]|uniref:hypothetical protein n=1 Tax=Methylobacterium sp. E-065 TaxID=2836583 RepID=UPI001FBA515B|nr:hypothetical protein [Methylobacterium sp. E-065]MCJ2016025.1 hypothetical protein [Methylobacterium sp. E-065]